MNNYKVDYEILDYNKFYDRLEKIQTNQNNKFKVEKLSPLGKTKCGFDIEHYKIGNGPIHIVYMGGCHGNEIISVDYVTQLMNNIALGLGEYETFNPDLFSIDFIPCQNPEGFFTTTYALNSYMKNMNETEIESFCKDYYQAYRQDDTDTMIVNRIFNNYIAKINSNFNHNIQEEFWNIYRNKSFNIKDLIAFLILKNNNEKEPEIKELVTSLWQEKLKLDYVVPSEKYHHKIFSSLTLDCIPEIDDKHKKLKIALQKLYSNNNFPIGTLANFFANASGINLNDNNEYFYEDLKKATEANGQVYGKFRENNLSKSIPGPIGTASENLNEPFKYTEENIALLNFLEDNKDNNFIFMNCHGTGGLVFLYPVVDDDLDKAHTEMTERPFQFYINNRLITEYTKKTGNVYSEYTGVNDPYKMQGYPEKITGVGDVLRKKYLASFILELSKMGGNPLAPYGEKNKNYYLTMISNFSANYKMMQTLLELRHLYDINYTMEYNDNKVNYGIKYKK